MPYLDLDAEGAEQFGASDVEHLTWKQLLDGYSCTECGRCTAACPANITGKVLSPRKIIVNARQRLMEKAPLLVGDVKEVEHPRLVHGEGADAGARTVNDILEHRLLDQYITEEELWQCTTCRACVQECPVGIEHLDMIIDLRRNLVLMESRFPAEVQPAFESMERNGSPWAFSPGDRARWADGLDIPTMAEIAERGEPVDVLFWVGCMGVVRRPREEDHRRLRAHHAGGGHPLRDPRPGRAVQRRPGAAHGQRVPVADARAREHRDAGPVPRAHGRHASARTAFTRSATSIPQLGGDYEVIHHSTYIERLLDAGRIPLARWERRRAKHRVPRLVLSGPLQRRLRRAA